MKMFMRVVVGFVAVLLLMGQSEAQVDVKVGGGLLLDNSRWGGHLSADIPIGDTHPTYLSPFVEFYRTDLGGGANLNEIPVGVNLLYKAPFSEQYGVVYFGIGGGMFLARGVASATEPMVTAGGGLLLDASDSIGIFAQGRWFRAFTTGSKNEMSLHVGLSFRLGEE